VGDDGEISNLHYILRLTAENLRTGSSMVRFIDEVDKWSATDGADRVLH
jgi:hypothetical protein